MKNYSEDGLKRMIEAGERGRITSKKKSELLRLEYLSHPNYCIMCKNIIPYEKRDRNTYCSSSCSAKASNSSRKKHSSCLGCGKTIQVRNKYCSVQCQKNLLYDQTIKDWLEGNLAIDGKSECPSPIRRYLLDQCGHRCPKCGWGEVNPVTGKIPLELNHIDGDSKNHSPNNLEILCPNCHSLTPNFRALNKKSTRTHRTKK